MISFIQILLIVTALTAISYEVLMTQQIVKTCGDSVLMGFLTGLIMGDVTTGLLIGGTMQLMRTGQQPSPLSFHWLEGINGEAGFQRGDVRHEPGFNRFKHKTHCIRR